MNSRLRPSSSSDLTPFDDLEPLPLPPANPDRFAYSGVHHIFDQHSEAITRLVFKHNDGQTFLCSSMDGGVSLCHLDTPSHEPFLGGHEEGVIDLDLSESNELAVSCSYDGLLILWDMRARRPLRRMRALESGAYLNFCRFLPQNNNLVVCGASTGVIKIMNVSTGKFVVEGSPVLGKSLSVAMNHQGTLVWVGSDRGYIESFRLDCEQVAKIHKGSRRNIADPKSTSQQHQEVKPITSLCVRSSPSSLSRHPVLLVNQNSNVFHVFSIVDDFGTLEPLLALDAPDVKSTLMCSQFAPLLSFRGATCVAAGADDGTLVFFDLERRQRPCLNKLSGHARSVLAVSFSHDERFIASGDTSGQIIVWKK